MISVYIAIWTARSREAAGTCEHIFTTMRNGEGREQDHNGMRALRQWQTRLATNKLGLLASHLFEYERPEYERPGLCDALT